MRRAIAAVVLAAAAVVSRAAETMNALDRPLREHLTMLALTLLGGFVSWSLKVRKGMFPATSIFHLIGEMAAALLAGSMAYVALVEWAGVTGGMAGGLSGLAGLMGTRALERAEQWALRKFDRMTKG